MKPFNHLAGVGDGRTPQFTEMNLKELSYSSGSARLAGC